MAKEAVQGLADRLRIARMRMQPEVKQKDAGKIVGRSAPCIGQWESGKSEPAINDLIKLANHYCVSVDWLLGLETRASHATESLIMSRHPTGTNSVPVLSTKLLMEGVSQSEGAYITAGRSYPDGDVFAWPSETDAMNRCSSGDLVIVQRDYDPANSGIYMIIASDSKTPTLRRCRLDEGQVFFAPDSQAYPTYNGADVKIIGRVREIIKHALLD